jgi:hypothetical protein
MSGHTAGRHSGVANPPKCTTPCGSRKRTLAPRIGNSSSSSVLWEPTWWQRCGGQVSGIAPLHNPSTTPPHLVRWHISVLRPNTDGHACACRRQGHGPIVCPSCCRFLGLRRRRHPDNDCTSWYHSCIAPSACALCRCTTHTRQHYSVL